MEILLGFAIACLVGLTGVGGGVLTASALILLLGTPTPMAVGTALAFSAVIKLPAVAIYLARRQVDGTTLFLMLVGGVPGMLVGSLLLDWGAERLRAAVLVAVGCTVIASALVNLFVLVRRPQRPLTPGGVGRRIPPLTFLIGAEMGFSSAGAGALGTLVLFCLTPLAPAAVVGTDLAFGLILAALGGGIHFAMSAFDPGLFLRLAAGGVFGAVAGALLAGVVPARPLRVGLLLWLTVVGSEIVARGIELGAAR